MSLIQAIVLPKAADRFSLFEAATHCLVSNDKRPSLNLKIVQSLIPVFGIVIPQQLDAQSGTAVMKKLRVAVLTQTAATYKEFCGIHRKTPWVLEQTGINCNIMANSVRAVRQIRKEIHSFLTTADVGKIREVLEHIENHATLNFLLVITQEIFSTNVEKGWIILELIINRIVKKHDDNFTLFSVPVMDSCKKWDTLSLDAQANTLYHLGNELMSYEANESLCHDERVKNFLIIITRYLLYYTPGWKNNQMRSAAIHIVETQIKLMNHGDKPLTPELALAKEKMSALLLLFEAYSNDGIGWRASYDSMVTQVLQGKENFNVQTAMEQLYAAVGFYGRGQ
jgi:hypothetical protein